jgi:positive regulator of sigma E activity
MNELAEVLSVQGASVMVRCTPAESCESCASPLCSPRMRTYVASIDPARDTGVVPGVWVEVAPAGSGAAKGALLFGLPLVLFTAVYLSLRFTASEVLQALGGFVGLGIGLWIAIVVARVWKDPDPRVVRIYDSRPALPADSRPAQPADSV